MPAPLTVECHHAQERERQRGGDAKLNKERAREEKRLRKLMAKANKARAEREKSVAQPPLPTDTSQPPLPTDSGQPPLPTDAAQPPPPPRPAFSGKCNCLNYNCTIKLNVIINLLLRNYCFASKYFSHFDAPTLIF